MCSNRIVGIKCFDSCLNFTRSDNDITKDNTSHTTDEDNSSFTVDLSDSGPLTYISSLTIIDEEDEMVEQYPDHDMPDKISASFSQKMLDVTTKDIKRIVAINALKQCHFFEDIAI